MYHRSGDKPLDPTTLLFVGCFEANRELRSAGTSRSMGDGFNPSLMSVSDGIFMGRSGLSIIGFSKEAPGQGGPKKMDGYVSSK